MNYIAARRELDRLGGEKRGVDAALEELATTVRLSGMRKAAETELLEQVAALRGLLDRAAAARLDARQAEASDVAQHMRAAQDTLALVADARLATVVTETALAVRAETEETTLAIDRERNELHRKATLAIERERERLGRETAVERQRLRAEVDESAAALRARADKLRAIERRLEDENASLARDCELRIAKAQAEAAKLSVDVETHKAQADKAQCECANERARRQAQEQRHDIEKAQWAAQMDADMATLDTKVRRLLAARDAEIARLQQRDHLLSDIERDFLRAG